MLPTTLEISGFRSFGQTPIVISSLKKLNFFVGQNNSGKSNVLRAITLLSGIRGQDPSLSPRSSDFAQGAENICAYLHFPNSVLKECFYQRGGQRSDPELAEIDESKSFAFPFTLGRDNSTTFTDEQVDHFVLSTQI